MIDSKQGNDSLPVGYFVLFSVLWYYLNQFIVYEYFHSI